MFTRFCVRVSRPGHTCLQVALCCYNKSLWLLPQALALLSWRASADPSHTPLFSGVFPENCFSLGSCPDLAEMGFWCTRGLVTSLGHLLLPPLL